MVILLKKLLTSKAKNAIVTLHSNIKTGAIMEQDTNNTGTSSAKGFFDRFGGKYVGEVLRRPLDELEQAFNKYMQDKSFLEELEVIRRD